MKYIMVHNILSTTHYHTLYSQDLQDKQLTPSIAVRHVCLDMVRGRPPPMPS